MSVPRIVHAPPVGPFESFTFQQLTELAARHAVERKEAEEAAANAKKKGSKRPAKSKSQTTGATATSQPRSRAPPRSRSQSATDSNKSKRKTVDEVLIEENAERSDNTALHPRKRQKATAYARAEHPWPDYLTPPSFPLTRAKNDSDVSAWLSEARAAWALCARERDERLGADRERFHLAPAVATKPITKRSSTAKSSKKLTSDRARELVEQARKSMTIAARTVSLPVQPIEDTELSSYRAHESLPVDSCSFNGCPVEFISDMLRLYDLLSIFSSPLSFDCAPCPWSLSSLLESLTRPASPDEDHIVNSIGAVLMRCTLRQSDVNSTRKKVMFHELATDTANDRSSSGDGLVCNRLTWQSHLKEWLNTVNGSRAVPKRHRRDWRYITAFLHTDTFYQLSVPLRLLTLLTLMKSALQSQYMRSFLNSAIENHLTTRKSVNMQRHMLVAEQRAIDNNLSAVALCLYETVIAVEKSVTPSMTKKERSLAEDAVNFDKLLMHGKQWLQRRVDDRTASMENELSECQRLWPMRTEMLGLDRHCNLYWKLGNDISVLFVEYDPLYLQQYRTAAQATTKVKFEFDSNGASSSSSSSPVAAKQESESVKFQDSTAVRWGYIHNSATFASLLNSLNPMGLREKKLRDALSNQRWRWLDPTSTVKVETVDLNHSLSLIDRSFPQLMTDAPLSSLVPSVLTYQQLFEISKSSLRASARLALNDGLNDEARCSVCQDTWDPSSDQHCNSCHELFPVAHYIQHQLACKGEAEARRLSLERVLNDSVNDRGEERNTFTITVAQRDLKSRRRKPDTDEELSSEESADEAELQEEEERREEEERQQHRDEKKDDNDSSMKTEDSDSTAVKPETINGKEPSVKREREITAHRITPRPDSLAATSPTMKVLKALLLDLESCIPIEAVRQKNVQSHRLQWVDTVKLSLSVKHLGLSLLDLYQNLKSGWARRWFKGEEWSDQCKAVNTEADFAAVLFTFDRALLYSEEDRLKAITGEMDAENGVEDEDEQAENEEFDGCRVCGGGEEGSLLILCDGCEAAYHLHCLRPRLKEVPEGDWFCPDCQAQQPQQRSTTKKSRAAKQPTLTMSGKRVGRPPGSKNKPRAARDEEPVDDFGICRICIRNEGDPLLCDRCDDAYHLDCLSPPLDTVPKGDWYCPNCMQEMAEAPQLLRTTRSKSHDAVQMSETDDEDAEMEAEDETEVNMNELPTDDEDENAPLMSNTTELSEDDEGEAELFSNTMANDDDNEEEISEEVDDDEVCNVCFNPDSTDANPIIMCDGCDNAVHLSCQGLAFVPDGDWYCDRCVARFVATDSSCPCYLCGRTLDSGMMKETQPNSGRWCHISCAIYVPGITFDDVDTHTGIRGEVSATFKGRTCAICKTSRGATLPCQSSGCREHFHVPCALANKEYELRFEVDENSENVNLVAHCKRHAAHE